MKVVLTWSLYKGNPPPFEQSHEFTGPVSIGRSPDNDFVLHDPEKFCSRYHARIIFQNGLVYIEDTSAGGTTANQQFQISNGQRFELQDGDRLEFGENEITVSLLDSNLHPPTVGFQQLDVTESTTQLEYPNSRQYDDADDVFDIDDFFASEQKPVSAPPASSSGGNYSVGSAFTPPKAAPIKDECPIDDIFASVAPNSPEPQEFGTSIEQRAVIDRNSPNSVNTEISQDTAALRAFLSELGLEPQQLIGQNKVDVMRVAGIVMKTLTEGMMGVLSARDSVKLQFDMDRTQIQKSKNNPFKFSQSPQEAMTKMLTQEPGYMDPVASANEAVADAKAHQIAMISGLNAAIEATINEFDPGRLEKQFKVGFSLNKNAKYWDCYCELFSKLAKDIRSSSNTAFTEQFRENYLKQIEMLNKKD